MAEDIDYYEEVRRIKKNLKSRINRISKREDLPQYAVESFRNFESRLRKKLDGKGYKSLDESEIRTIYRDIVYIDNLKTASIKGAEETRMTYVPIRERLESLSDNLKDKVKELHNKLVGETGMWNIYRYEVTETEIDLITEGYSVDDAFKELLDIHDSAYVETQKEDNQVVAMKYSLTDKLQKFREDVLGLSPFR